VVSDILVEELKEWNPSVCVRVARQNASLNPWDLQDVPQNTDIRNRGRKEVTV